MGRNGVGSIKLRNQSWWSAALWNPREGHTMRKHRARRGGLHSLGLACMDESWWRPRLTWLSVHSRIATPKTRRHRIISCSRAVLAGVLLPMFAGVQRSTVRSASTTNFSSPPNTRSSACNPATESVAGTRVQMCKLWSRTNQSHGESSSSATRKGWG